jgi:mutator protein MutT
MQEVVAAIILQNQQVLCAKRPGNGVLGNLWEFPGGKVEPGETLEEALHREIKEELSIGIRIQEPFMSLVHTYPTHTVQVHTYLCEWASGDMIPLVHSDIRFVTIEDLDELEWVAADDPVIAALKKKLLL